MKRLVLLFTVMLASLTTVSASEFNSEKKGSDLDNMKRYRYAQPIIFMERGVEFLIFPDGSFDFNTNTRDQRYNDAYYNTNSRRGSVNISYRGPRTNIQYSSNNYNRGVAIIRDRDGMVRRIGDVYLNYDRLGRITHAGSVFMEYNRGNYGDLRRVGDLRVDYNRWGEIIELRGQVNRFNNNCNVCGALSCNTNHRDISHNDRHHDRFDNDDNYYYYKQNGKVKKYKKNKR